VAATSDIADTRPERTMSYESPDPQSAVYRKVLVCTHVLAST